MYLRLASSSMNSRVTLNWKFSCLHFLSARMAGLHRHAQFMWLLGIKLRAACKLNRHTVDCAPSPAPRVRCKVTAHKKSHHPATKNLWKASNLGRLTPAVVANALGSPRQPALGPFPVCDLLKGRLMILSEGGSPRFSPLPSRKIVLYVYSLISLCCCDKTPWERKELVWLLHFQAIVHC